MDSIAGTYCGVLPPNVETILTLNADGTYRLKQKSLNDSDSCEVLNGIFKVLDGSILMLEHPKSGDNIFYKVKNDSSIIATMLDELCELPMSQYDLARNMSYLVSYMNSIVS